MPLGDGSAVDSKQFGGPAGGEGWKAISGEEAFTLVLVEPREVRKE